jgi:hypothetical protein
MCWLNLDTLYLSKTSNLTLNKFRGILHLFNKLERAQFPTSIFHQSIDEIGMDAIKEKIGSLLLDLERAIFSRTLKFRGFPDVIRPFITDDNM